MTKSASFDKKNQLFPRVGELWDCLGRIAVIAGNSLDERGRLWVMDWDAGARLNASSDMLMVRADRKSVSPQQLVDRFAAWARAGNDDAMWFLAYWFEGSNHPRSTWYYVAALRADWSAYQWAYSRIFCDAHKPVMCKGVPAPDLGFLEGIPEFAERKIVQHAWRDAVANAEKALHIAANNQPKETAFR